MSKKTSQKVLVPKGTIDPDEDTVIEIPNTLQGQSIIIAKRKDSERSMKCSRSSRSVKYDDEETILESLNKSKSKSSVSKCCTDNDNFNTANQTLLDLEKTECAEKQLLESKLKEFQEARRKFVMEASSLATKGNSTTQEIGSCKSKSELNYSQFVPKPSCCSQNHPTSSTWVSDGFGQSANSTMKNMVCHSTSTSDLTQRSVKPTTSCLSNKKLSNPNETSFLETDEDPNKTFVLLPIRQEWESKTKKERTSCPSLKPSKVDMKKSLDCCKSDTENLDELKKQFRDARKKLDEVIYLASISISKARCVASDTSVTDTNLSVDSAHKSESKTAPLNSSCNLSKPPSKNTLGKPVMSEKILSDRQKVIEKAEDLRNILRDISTCPGENSSSTNLETLTVTLRKEESSGEKQEKTVVLEDKISTAITTKRHSSSASCQ